MLLEDECGFLGHMRRKCCYAPAVAAELEKHWSRVESEGLPIGLPGSESRKFMTGP